MRNMSSHRFWCICQQSRGLRLSSQPSSGFSFSRSGVSLSFPRLSPQPGLSVCTAVALSLIFHVCNCTHLAGQAVFRFSLSLSKSTACLSVVVWGKYPLTPLFPSNSPSLKIKSSLSENISRESTPSPLSHYINVNSGWVSLMIGLTDQLHSLESSSRTTSIFQTYPNMMSHISCSTL